MALHTATITWSRGNGDFLDKRYHRAHASCFLANSVKTQIDCAPVLEVEGG